MAKKQAPETDGELTEIRIIGAREHNLKNIDVTIPRDKLTVITGLSGSGKSSLAFDTLYAEGQRRYVTCLSAYAKQYLGMMKKPSVDSIEGLSPAISIEQKTLGYNPRSTVGTVTEIYDYLRLLYSKIGTQYAIESGLPVVQRTSDQIIEEILEEFSGRPVLVAAPVIRARKGHYRELFEQFFRQGFTKVRVDGTLRDIEPGMQLERFKIHDIELVIDRLQVDKSNESRLSGSVELGLKKGDGTITIMHETDKGVWETRMLSTNYCDPVTGTAYDKLAPNMFSFNSPYGACKKCEGLGEIFEFDMSLVIPDKSLSVNEGAIKLCHPKKHVWIYNQAAAFAKQNAMDFDKPLSQWKEEDLSRLLFGGENSEIEMSYSFTSSGSKASYKHAFHGIVPAVHHWYENFATGVVKKFIESFLVNQPCPECNGGRLNKRSLNVLINKKSIADIVSLDIGTARKYFLKLSSKLTDRQNKIAGIVIKEIASRLEFLDDVGLSYLSLGRGARTLSGGEAQRIRLASQIGSKLVGIMYVLDEPSIGLHQHDNYKLIKSLKNLRDLGNTLVVVEHDKAMIEEADFFIDMGPGAGIHGGEVVLISEPSKIRKMKPSQTERSSTAKYLNGEASIPYNPVRREGNGKSLLLKGAKGNNLKGVDLELGLGKLICITGMSGSGKSSLINDTLFPVLSRHFNDAMVFPLPYESIDGLQNIDKVIEIDQSPIGRSPRSNPATYTGLFTLIRDFFTLLPEAKIRGYKSGRFSFNVSGGRCEECEGAGLKKIEMSFLPDVYVVCDVCEGRRYNNETLQVFFKGKNISDVLEMSVEEALDFFKDIPKIREKLQTLNDVGLTYIKLGQQAPTLSGGEAQRVKLASELSKRSTGKTLYLLDEPTTGLHFEDIRILLEMLNKLVDKGNTVLIIEHNLDVIKAADSIIDLGPGGGDSGGRIVAQGTPEEVAADETSLTGLYLRPELAS